MRQTNYSSMSDQELREYFLVNKYDQSALQAYLARRNSKPRKVITRIDDIDFDLKIE